MTEELGIPTGPSSATLGPHGVHVETHGAPDDRHEEVLLFVHGAGCGSWYWEHALPYFAERGWSGAALDWRGHHRSAPMAPDELAGVTVFDYVEDVDTVAAALGRPVVVVAHSIGGLVALKHAEIGMVQPRGLVLLGCAPPAEVGGYRFPSYGDRYPAPAYDVTAARTLFFHDIDPEALERYVGLLGPESVRVLNASGRNHVDVDPQRVSGPVAVVAADHDAIQGLNSGIERDIARVYGADYFVTRGHGHLSFVENGWEDVAGVVERWLRRQFPAS